MGKKSYLPRKDSELVTWAENFVLRLAAFAAAWGIPMDEVDRVRMAFDAYRELYRQTKSPDRTSVIVAQKNEARETLTGLIRGMVEFRLKNPIITDDQLISLGLHVKDKTLTPVPPPDKSPKVNLRVVANRCIEVMFQDQDTTSKAKPTGWPGVVVAYAILSTPPANQDELTHTVLATRTPYILEFKEEDRGKIVYIALRWQNTKGQVGPWSELMSTIVP